MTHEFPMDKCLPDLLWEQVRAQPNSTAVVYQDTYITYHELANRSCDLARYLRSLGVAVEDCVGVFVEPSLELIVGIWGILLAGAAYLPLSPEYPEERTRYMIEDSGTTLVFSQERLNTSLTMLVPQGTRIITLADAQRFAESSPPAERHKPAELHPGNLANVIYTSGSTGKPKGVMIEHRNLTNQMQWLKTVQGLSNDKTIIQKTPMSFDAAQWEILASSCGSKVVVGGPGIYRDPTRLIEMINAHGVTTLQCVPTLLQALLDTEELQNCKTLVQIFSGGEALSRDLALQCLQTLPNCELVNLYGPTECTINSSSFTVDPVAIQQGRATVSIGTPVHNTQYHILKESREPVGVGEVGELYIGGIQIGRGYLHQPQLTADRFIPNPFASDRPGSRLYRTGDLVSRE